MTQHISLGIIEYDEDNIPDKTNYFLIIMYDEQNVSVIYILQYGDINLRNQKDITNLCNVSVTGYLSSSHLQTCTKPSIIIHIFMMEGNTILWIARYELNNGCNNDE